MKQRNKEVLFNKQPREMDLPWGRQIWPSPQTLSNRKGDTEISLEASDLLVDLLPLIKMLTLCLGIICVLSYIIFKGSQKSSCKLQACPYSTKSLLLIAFTIFKLPS